MHGSVQTVPALMTEIIKGLSDISKNRAVAVCPSFVHLELVGKILKTSDSHIGLGAQDARAENEGAFTGDVSVSMLTDFGTSFVLVGHSERRQGAGESNNLVAAKFGAVQDQGLTPVLCVGESLSQREEGETEKAILSQVCAIIDKLGFSAFERALIAYEPIWAIGTGITATPEQAQAVH